VSTADVYEWIAQAVDLIEDPRMDTADRAKIAALIAIAHAVAAQPCECDRLRAEREAFPMRYVEPFPAQPCHGDACESCITPDAAEWIPDGPDEARRMRDQERAIFDARVKGQRTGDWGDLESLTVGWCDTEGHSPECSGQHGEADA